jgi:hypothetical protein
MEGSTPLLKSSFLVFTFEGKQEFGSVDNLVGSK